jgi:hypothetical protein
VAPPGGRGSWLDAVEIEDGHIGPPDPARLAEVRVAADRHGVAIVDVALMNNFGAADAERRRAEVAACWNGWMPPAVSAAASCARSPAGGGEPWRPLAGDDRRRA